MSETPELRWTHCTNWLSSHFAQPDGEHWADRETGIECAVCRECGYVVEYRDDWQQWRT